MMFSPLFLLFLTLFYSPSVTTKSDNAVAKPWGPAPKITPLDIKMSSEKSHPDRIAANCIDGSTTNNKMCHTSEEVKGEYYPWVTLVIPHSIVTKVRITNRKDGYEDRMKNMKIWTGKEFPSTAKEEYTGGALLGTFKGPGTKGQVVEIGSSYPKNIAKICEKLQSIGKECKGATHVVVQMETDIINLSEIEVFGYPVRNTARCIDTGCKKTGLGEKVEAECVYLKNANWTSISHIYNVSTPWKEGLCKGPDSKEDCCKCLPRLPVGCVDVKNACKDAFGGLGVCKNFVKDDMSAIDFEQGSKKNLCNVAEPDCCECFSLKKTKTTKP